MDVDSEPLAIGPDEVVDDHPCTATSLYAVDRGLIAYMLQDVRALVRLWADGTTAVDVLVTGLTMLMGNDSPSSSTTRPPSMRWVDGGVPGKADLAKSAHGTEADLASESGRSATRRFCAGCVRTTGQKRN